MQMPNKAKCFLIQKKKKNEHTINSTNAVFVLQIIEHSVLFSKLPEIYYWLFSLKHWTVTGHLLQLYEPDCNQGMIE